ncbi:MAG: PorT family protein [Cyclobacteriaceae bacterium]|nr:PorT family protein [Cyclobacteriaceae bacterium]
MRQRYLLFFGLLFSTFLYGQDADREQIISQATDEFNAGRFYGLPALLKPVLDDFRTTNEQRVRVYLLLAQAYLILDDPIAADDSYLKLLKADPEYVANPARDPIDVYYLSKKFTSTPIFTPHLRIGLNTSLVRTIYEINTSGVTLSRKNIPKAGFRFGGGLDWNIDNHWSICLEGNYSYRAIKQERKGLFTANGQPSDTQVILEKQNWIDIPMYIKYADDSGKIRPFGYAGFAINLLLSSNGTDWLLKNNSSDGNSREATGPKVNLTPKRNFFNRSLVVGGGAKYKIGKDFVFADLRYMIGLSNLTKEDANYYDKDGNFDTSIPRYAYVSDLFRLDNILLSFGYIHPIYDPRKKTKPKLKNLFRKQVTEERQ